MSYTNFVDDIFSPVRFDSSLADSSVNSGGSITSGFNFEISLASKDSPENKFTFELDGAKMNDHAGEYGSSHKFIQSNLKSEELNNLTPTKDSSNVSTHSEKLSALMTSSLDKKRLPKNSSTEGKLLEVSHIQNEVGLSKPKVVVNKTRLHEQYNTKEKKPIRPTTLLSFENSAVTDKGKRETNAMIKKSKSSKDVRNKEKVQKVDSADLLVKASALDKSVLDAKKISLSKPANASVKQTVKEKKTFSGKLEELNQHSENSKVVSNPSLEIEHEVIEKMVNFHVSCGCDNIRQNIYSQQMQFFKGINKMKDEMQRQHVATTGHLLKTIEELVRINAFLKENKQI